MPSICSRQEIRPMFKEDSEETRALIFSLLSVAPSVHRPQDLTPFDSALWSFWFIFWSCCFTVCLLLFSTPSLAHCDIDLDRRSLHPSPAVPRLLGPLCLGLAKLQAVPHAEPSPPVHPSPAAPILSGYLGVFNSKEMGLLGRSLQLASVHSDW